VAGVAAMKEQEPEFVDGLLNAIQRISDEAQRALADPELSREALLANLSVRSSVSFTRHTVITLSFLRLSSARTTAIS
jgi:mevalonate kinase